MIKVNDIDIACRVTGSGPPLVLIMGLTATMDWWDPAFLEALARDHTVVVFDNRGAGRTVCLEGEFTIEQFADDTAGLMDALGIEEASVLGYSMGGMIAQELALRHSGRVDNLVLYATYCGGNESVFGDKEVLMRLVDRSGTVDDLIERFLTLMFSREWITSNRDLLADFKRRYLLAPTSDHAATRQFVATVKFNASDRIATLRVPTMVVCGARDILIPPQNSRLIASKIPGAKLKEYPEAGHGFIWECSGACLEDLADFLG
ncbi:MAG: alpha/beta fold hydrolase [Candidatus Geothermincolia bacterium]